MAFSLYIHIPFCLKRCIYCDFVSGIYSHEKADAYIKALKQEILNISHEIVLGKESERLSSLYIGGGTPTSLSASTLSDLVNYIFEHLRFIENYEATIEANPGTLNKEKLQVIHSSGINRISIGIQSFNDDELRCLGRLHSSRDAEKAVYLARDAGFENIGIDLIYGIPGQDIDEWKKTLKKAVRLKPKHISAYELTVVSGTALHKHIKAHKLIRLDEGKIIEMYKHTIDYLKEQGFLQYEISNFALPGYSCRHNLNYWNRGEYYGAGLGAHSLIERKRFFNTDNIGHYMEALSENKSPVRESESMNDERALSEAIELYGKEILKLYHDEIRELQEAGLISIHGSSGNFETMSLNRSDCFRGTETHMKLTKKGILLSNEVFVKFL
jgi:oxygen-independent coproporphyrinogen-3 oxidase